MKIHTKDLTGAALDWSVAVALGWKLERPQDGQFIDNDGNRWLAGYRQYAPKISFSPSSNWAQGGPLVQSQLFWVEEQSYDQWGAEGVGGETQYGPTALIAICRAVVACKLGDEVDVPDELVPGGAA